MKTKAAVLRQIGGPLSLEDVEIPKLMPGQVLVKVLATGLCHSQLNEIRGRKGAEHIPHMMGHEAAGLVMELGVGVTKVKAGDYVVLTWIKGSGHDVPGCKYQSTSGPVSAGAVATFTEYAVVSENRVVPISREVSPSVAALLGCAVPTGAGIVKNLGVKNGDTIAVFGIGGVGTSAIIQAKAVGAKVTAVDIVDWKLQWIDSALGLEDRRPSEVGSRKFDFTIECSGSREAMEMAFSLTRDGGTTVLAGNLPPNTKISIDPFDLIKGKKLLGSWGGGSFPDRDIPLLAAEYLNGCLPVAMLVSRTYTFDQINDGLKDLEEGRLIKGVVEISKI